MTAMLSMDGVCVRLGARRIIANVSLEAAPGDFIGLVGPNGAGKSTLLKAAAGLLPVEIGAVRVGATRIADMALRNRARQLAYLPQARPVFWAVPARAVVALGRFAFGDPMYESDADKRAVEKALADCGAAHLSDRVASTLSGGELARVHLARALAGETPLLLADEPVAALDLKHQIEVMRLLSGKARDGGAVIAALHDLSLAAQYCTRIVVLNNGVVVADGPPADIINHDLLSSVFDLTPEDAQQMLRAPVSD